MGQKTLHLPLKAKWYEMIENRVKKEEYREIKPYWNKRFLKSFPVLWRMSFGACMASNDYSPFYKEEIHPIYDVVKFSYGYTKRTMCFELEKITIGKGNPEWGAPNKDVFIIKLGKRL